MEAIIKDIIRKIEKGNIFDSHFIIDTLIRDYSDDYLRFAAENLVSSKVTEYVHSEIAKIIASFRGTLVEQISDQSISYNIRGNISKCALWKKI